MRELAHWFPHWALQADAAPPRDLQTGSLEATQTGEPSPIFQESPDKQDESCSTFSGQPPL